MINNFLPVTKNVELWLALPYSFSALHKSIPVSLAVIFTVDMRKVSLIAVSLYKVLCKLQT